MLDYLFHRCVWKNSLVFKGGTSLSKAFHLIERFSEDIDLILDWRVLGYRLNEPWETRSNTQQEKFRNRLEEKTQIWLKTLFIPAVKTDIAKELSEDTAVYLDSSGESVVNFAYPQNFSDSSILQVIRLEIGPLAAWSPSKKAEITPFIAEQYPHIFRKGTTLVRTAVPERTFWEKATILHKEANRIKGEFPGRYSRHYYDLHQMAGHPVKISAFKNVQLLNDVVAFKKKFYRSPWADYDAAVPGTMKLVPSKTYYSSLKTDYEKMKNMIYGEVPSFNDILTGIKNLEDEINLLQTHQDPAMPVISPHTSVQKPSDCLNVPQSQRN